MATATFTKAGTKATSAVTLDKRVFGVEVPHHEVIHAAYVAYQANGRANLAKTLRRGEVSGGGKKPWRQKGTGRARFGSSRNPIWRGGGIAFGPSGQENYTKRLTTAVKRQALRQALTLANTNGMIKVIEDISSKGKTAELAGLLAKIEATGTVLIVTDTLTPELRRASANITSVTVVTTSYLNIAHIMHADTIIFTKSAVASAVEWLAKEKKS